MIYGNVQNYEGEWMNDKRSGWGRMTYVDGSYYGAIIRTFGNEQTFKDCLPFWHVIFHEVKITCYSFWPHLELYLSPVSTMTAF